jgi:hypothetical protein
MDVIEDEKRLIEFFLSHSRENEWTFLVFTPEALRFIPYDKEFELYSMVYRSSSETLLERSAP